MQPATARTNPRTNSPEPIDLGDLCRDTISGFQGVVTSHTRTINGNERFTLSQQWTDAKGNPRVNSFDARQLDLMKAAVIDPAYRS
jgi:hypothetical protein